MSHGLPSVSSSEHYRVDAAFAHPPRGRVRIVEIAVADDRNVDAALEPGDVLPVGLAFVKLLGGARVQRDCLHAGALRAPRDVEIDEGVCAPTQAHLHRHRAVDRCDDGGHDRLAAIRIAQTCRAAVRLRHFGCGTAEIDVDDVGAALAHDLRRERHRRGIVSPQLRGHRLLQSVLIDHLHRAPAPELQRVGRHELRHREAQTERPVERAHRAVGDARHRRKNQRRPSLDRADLQGCWAHRVYLTPARWKSCNPTRLRCGSTASTIGVCFATMPARPPVATTLASTPISPRIRATIASVWPAKP